MVGAKPTFLIRDAKLAPTKASSSIASLHDFVKENFIFFLSKGTYCLMNNQKSMKTRQNRKSFAVRLFFFLLSIFFSALFATGCEVLFSPDVTPAELLVLSLENLLEELASQEIDYICEFLSRCVKGLLKRRCKSDNASTTLSPGVRRR